MLLQFKFKNYKCFYDETILDLMATGEKDTLIPQLILMEIKFYQL